MKTSKPEAEYLDVQAAARQLGVGAGIARSLFNQWHESGGKTGIANVRVGEKLMRTTREDIRKWYEAQKRAANIAAKIAG